MLAIVGEEVGEVLLLLLAGELLLDLVAEGRLLATRGIERLRGRLRYVGHLDDVGAAGGGDRADELADVGVEDLRVDGLGEHPGGDRLAQPALVL